MSAGGDERHHPSSISPDVGLFGAVVAGVLKSILADQFIGAYFVGSIALGGYVPGESDIDIVAVCEQVVPTATRNTLADGLSNATARCPARGLEFTLYRREIAAETPDGAAFELNVNGGPRMERSVRVTPDGQPGFWYVLDRAIAHRHGALIEGPAPELVFADAPRQRLLDAMTDSMRWHRTHERATLYSVLNATRAWRFAEENMLGSKLDGASWARGRWKVPALIDAAVDLRHGRAARLQEPDVDELLDHVEQRLAVVSGDDHPT